MDENKSKLLNECAPVCLDEIIDPHRSLMEKHIDKQNVAQGVGRYATMVKTCVCFYAHLCKEAE